MSISESYASCITRGQVSDVVTAVAMCSNPLSRLLLRLRYANDSQSYHAIVDMLTPATPLKIVHEALRYYINPICGTCSGRGDNPRINMRGGLEVKCDHCNGTGAQGTDHLSSEANSLVTHLEIVERGACDEILKKLY